MHAQRFIQAPVYLERDGTAAPATTRVRRGNKVLLLQIPAGLLGSVACVEESAGRRFHGVVPQGIRVPRVLWVVYLYGEHTREERK